MEVLLVLGSKCNFRCSYCYTQLKEKPFRDDINVFESNLDKVFEHIDWHLERYPSVTLTEFGGEPLVYIDVWEKLIDRYVGNPKIRWNFITNGMLLPKCWDVLRVIPKNKLSMSISYDYSLQDETRQAGTYEPVREIIKEYSPRAQSFKTVTVFTADTLPRIGEVFQDYYSLVQECPRKYIARINLAKSTFKDGDDIYTNQELIKVLTNIKSFNSLHRDIGLRDNSLLLSRKNYEKYKGFLGGCYAICPDGKITWDCNSFFKGYIDNLYVGTIFEDPAEVYAARQDVLQQWNYHIDEKCYLCSATACKCPPFFGYETESPVHWGSIPKPEQGYYCKATKFISQFIYA